MVVSNRRPAAVQYRHEARLAGGEIGEGTARLGGAPLAVRPVPRKYRFHVTEPEAMSFPSRRGDWSHPARQPADALLAPRRTVRQPRPDPRCLCQALRRWRAAGSSPHVRRNICAGSCLGVRLARQPDCTLPQSVPVDTPLSGAHATSSGHPRYLLMRRGAARRQEPAPDGSALSSPSILAWRMGDGRRSACGSPGARILVLALLSGCAIGTRDARSKSASLARTVERRGRRAKRWSANPSGSDRAPALIALQNTISTNQMLQLLGCLDRCGSRFTSWVASPGPRSFRSAPTSEQRIWICGRHRAIAFATVQAAPGGGRRPRVSGRPLPRSPSLPLVLLVQRRGFLLPRCCPPVSV